MTVVSSISGLKSITGSTSTDLTQVLGYYLAGDQGGGFFYWDGLSTEADDGGTIIKPNAVVNGRWKRLIEGPINVACFGAKGDDATNDAPFLAAAFASPYSILLQSNKIYRTDSTLFITVDKKHIIGYGAEIKKTIITKNTISISNVDGFVLQGLKLTLSMTPYESGDGSAAIVIDSCKNYIIEDCEVNGSGDMGFNNRQCINGKFYRNKISNCFRDAIYAHYSIKMLYDGNSAYNIKDDAFSMHDYGQDSAKPVIIAAGFSQAGQSKIINNYVDTALQGIVSIGLDGLEVTGNTIRNVVGAGICLFNSALLFPNGTARVKNGNISNNIIYKSNTTQTFLGATHTNGNQLGTGRAGIFVGAIGTDYLYTSNNTRLSDIMINGNSVTYSGADGIFCHNTDRLKLDNNKCTNCNRDTSQYTNEIIEVKNCDNFSINSNSVIDSNDGGIKHSYAYAINETGSGSSRGWYIKGYNNNPGFYISDTVKILNLDVIRTGGLVANAGIGTLVNGTATINSSTIQGDSLVILTYRTLNTSVGTLTLGIISAGSYFTVNSYSANLTLNTGDHSTFSWQIIN